MVSTIEMENPLTYKREDLVALLERRLDERIAERERIAAEQAEKLAEPRERIIDALNDHPQFVIAVASAIKKAIGFDPDSADFPKQIAKHYDAPAGSAKDPDAALKKLIRAYQGASDTEVKVAITDDTYAYL